jgi:UDP-N-acetyl-D-galactosamine dehydrogenase
MNIKDSKHLMLSITFKENCPDVPNTKVVDVIKALKDYGMKDSIYDSWAEPKEVMHEYGLEVTNELPTKQFEAVVLGVAHNEFLRLDFEKLLNENGVLYDVKGVLDGDLVDGKL